MFCVYGKSKILAKKTIDKKLLSEGSDVSEAIAKLKNPTQDEKQSVINDFIDQEFVNCKVKRCTHEFGAPQIAREALALMKKDTNNFSDLSLMKKINKLNAQGGNVLNKKTKKPLMVWVSFY